MRGVRIGSYIERFLGASAEHIIGYGRLFLAAVCVAASIIDQEAPAEGLGPAQILLAGYFGFSLGIVLWGWVRPFANRLQQVVHGIDIAVASGALFVTHGAASPYFVLSVFVLLVGALRWRGRGPLLTALLLAMVLVIAYLGGFGGDHDWDELSVVVIRASFLMLAGVILAYLVGNRKRSQQRVAKLASWPPPQYEAGPGSLSPVLAHAGDVLGVARILVVWEEPEEPLLHVISWENGKLQYSRERRRVFGELVARSHQAASFIWVPRRETEPQPNLINEDLVRTFTIETAATAPFTRAACAGRVFVINRPVWTQEELALTEIVANRIGVEIEQLILRDRLEGAVSARERERLGRDLHDGLLQGLAAATMQLRATAEPLPAPIKKDLDGVRSIIADEAQRIRRFIEETRSPRPSTDGVIAVAPEVDKVAESCRKRWRCEVETEVAPRNLECSMSTARSIRHMINEAISNAVRHGRASRVEIRVSSQDGRIILSIDDNGSGFVHLEGSYTQKELSADNVGPLSLRSRIEELGGILYLTSTPTGANLTIEFPR
jgi:signal transduction histidine kinase